MHSTGGLKVNRGFRSDSRLSFRDRVLAFGSALVRSSMFGHDLIFQLEVLRDSSLERFSLSSVETTDFVLRIRERGPLIKINPSFSQSCPSTLVHRQLMKFVSKEVQELTHLLDPNRNPSDYPRFLRHATTVSSWRGVNDEVRSRFDH
jgi:hypothetical protein